MPPATLQADPSDAPTEANRTACNAAIYYAPDGYDTSSKKIMGRRAAGEAFLSTFATDPSVPELICFCERKADFDDFRQRVQALSAGRPPKPTRWLTQRHHADLAKVGTLYNPSPTISDLVWHRRRGNQRGYSVCGVFHTTASTGVMDELMQYHVAPVQPWDAVICTSSAMKSMAVRVLESSADYLASRNGVRPATLPQLPVIPLGVDAATFDPGAQQAADMRALWRERLKIGADDLVVLYFGRLSFHAKAHPLPMYVALSRAAQRVHQQVHLVQAGWFSNPDIERAFKQGAQELCANVVHHYLDGNDPVVRRTVWHAADVFTSLVDNIQETFGLVPVEAMAAGLPLVVSDWDGYRDTARHGVDGFAVPTWQPRPGAGELIAEQHAFGGLSYDRYLAWTSHSSVVDIEAAAEAYFQLLSNPELRRRMGQAGRRRAREVFDWRVVHSRYRELWAELADIRGRDGEVAPVAPDSPADPRRDDPFTLFASYPTRRIDERTEVTLSPEGPHDALERYIASLLSGHGTTGFGRDRVARAVAALLHRTSRQTVGELVARAPESDAAAVICEVGWLAKCGFVTLAPGEETP